VLRGQRPGVAVELFAGLPVIDPDGDEIGFGGPPVE
jgi:hypothetical protein